MHRCRLIGCLGWLVAAAGGAQDPRLLTEAEYLSALDEKHPAVRESAQALARAEARVTAARTFENPVLGGVREDPAGPIGQTDIVVSWQIPGAERGPEIEARESETQAVRTRLAHEFRTYRLAMREAYAGWAVAHTRRERLATRAERVESLARREAARAEGGEASGLEANRLRLAAATLRSRVVLAEVASEGARAEAAAWRPDLPVDTYPVLPDLPEAPSLDGVGTGVRAAEADLAAAELAREATRRTIASPEVTFGWRRQDLTPGAVDGPIFGFAWSVPLFDRRQASRTSSGAALEAARARLELVERESTTSRTAASNNFAGLSVALAEARQELSRSDRLLDGAEAAFRQGESGLTDLLETHRSVTEAELAMLDLHEAALAAHRELERLAGSAGAVDPLLAAAQAGGGARP